MIAIFKAAADFVLFLFTLFLFARIVLSLVIAYARDWRPKGATLVVTEAVFTMTDPPLKAVRRFVPPLTLGQVRLDLAMLILFFGILVLRALVATIPE